ncbi:glycoside hydrolase family 16 protein [Modestobacter sp. VKM Ac-2986]|nr:glycoside hydrolase family 16 protein [Modestobacter sp. VKM Ac-2986]
MLLTTVGSLAVTSQLLDGGAAGAGAQAAAPAPAPAPAPPAPVVPLDGPPGLRSDWTPVFVDEFDGPVIDASKWRSNRYGGETNDGAFNPEIEDAYYSPGNVSVVDGTAALTIQPDPRTVDGVEYTHSSGCMTTQGNFLAQDGDYIEARIWIPIGDGLWPAFWTVPDDRWPPEIDIMEYFDTSILRPPAFVYHFPGPVGMRGEHSIQPYGDAAVDYRDSWHTYGLLRTQGRVVPYLDGVAYPEAGVSAGVDDLPQFLTLNLAMYTDRAPTPGTQMRIDWVRVWRPS